MLKMAVSEKHKLFTFIFLFPCLLVCTVHAQNGPAIMFQRAAFCFNNRFIYSGCNEAFRLNERGEINVPKGETGQFCNGPCLEETERVLKCVDDIMSDFVFFNGATPRVLGNMLRFGCSSSDRRGNFNVRDYMQGFTLGKAERTANLICVFATLVVAGFALWAL